MRVPEMTNGIAIMDHLDACCDEHGEGVALCTVAPQTAIKVLAVFIGEGWQEMSEVIGEGISRTAVKIAGC